MSSPNRTNFRAHFSSSRIQDVPILPKFCQPNSDDDKEFFRPKQDSLSASLSVFRLFPSSDTTTEQVLIVFCPPISPSPTFVKVVAAVESLYHITFTFSPTPCLRLLIFCGPTKSEAIRNSKLSDLPCTIRDPSSKRSILLIRPASH